MYEILKNLRLKINVANLPGNLYRSDLKNEGICNPQRQFKNYMLRKRVSELFILVDVIMKLTFIVLFTHLPAK